MALSESDLCWRRDGPSWPLSDSSIFVRSDEISWHVQRYGSGTDLLLVHGTGASTHTWAGLGPRLAAHFTVTAIDLPGHGFTQPVSSRRISLDGYATLVSNLSRALSIRPAVAIGHSAGAAILIRMALDDPDALVRIIGLNAALAPFPGASGQLFPILAKLMLTNSVVPRLFAWRARSHGAVDSLLSATGSRVPDRSAAIYSRLFQSPRHVTATLNMMANWDLGRLQRDLGRLKVPTCLLAGARDRMIASRESHAASRATPAATTQIVNDVGHLMHEEAPDRIAGVILQLEQGTETR